MFIKHLTRALALVVLAASLVAGAALAALPARTALAQSPDDGFDPGADDWVAALALMPTDTQMLLLLW